MILGSLDIPHGLGHVDTLQVRDEDGDELQEQMSALLP